VLNVGTPEMLVILVVALLVLGPNKLPEVARQVGKAVGEIRRLGAGFQAEMRDAMQEPVHLDPVEPADAEPEPDVDATAATEGVAPGWSPDTAEDLTATVHGEETEVMPPVEDEPPGGVAPV
jgi:Tat protein translocase TatB subunit